MNEADSNSQETFAEEANAESTGLVKEFIDFLKDNKKWWMLPILVVLFGVGALVILSTTTVAPFIYTLF